METYDRIGVGYTRRRATDPRIATQLYRHLEGAASILNIGAGTGSYEPENPAPVALEPSAEMISQRPDGAYSAVQGVAEQLPFSDNSFSHVLTVLSMHHWRNLAAAYREINRVATAGFLALTWLPDAGPFWLTRDYFPAFYDADCEVFPGIKLLEAYFDDVQVEPMPIPEDCIDGFLAAYWKRPEAYLDPAVRQSISSFACADKLEAGLDQLRQDIGSGAWLEKNSELMRCTSIDAGYRIIFARTRKQA